MAHTYNYLKCKCIKCTNQKTQTGWVNENMHVCTSTYHITLLDPPDCMQLFYIVRLIMFPLWLAIIIIFYFLSGYWLWKLTNISYYCDYVTITQYCCIMIGQQKKRPTENKPKTIKKTVTGLYIAKMTLNVNGLNTLIKRHRLGGWRHVHVCTFTYDITMLDIIICIWCHIQIVYVTILYC